MIPDDVVEDQGQEKSPSQIITQLSDSISNCFNQLGAPLGQYQQISSMIKPPEAFPIKSLAPISAQTGIPTPPRVITFLAKIISSTSLSIETDGKPWHNPTAHSSSRLLIQQSIQHLIFQLRPNADLQWLETLNEVGSKVEARLYFSADSFEEYFNGLTLIPRITSLVESLVKVAEQLGAVYDGNSMAQKKISKLSKSSQPHIVQVQASVDKALDGSLRPSSRLTNDPYDPDGNNAACPQISSQGCSRVFIVKILLIISHYVRWRRLPSIFTFDRAVLLKWIEDAKRACCTDSYLLEEEYFGGCNFVESDSSTHWVVPSQLFSWWKNNLERKSKMKILEEDASYIGYDPRRVCRARWCETVIALAKVIRSSASSTSTGQRYTSLSQLTTSIVSIETLESNCDGDKVSNMPLSSTDYKSGSCRPLKILSESSNRCDSEAGEVEQTAATTSSSIKIEKITQYSASENLGGAISAHTSNVAPTFSYNSSNATLDPASLVGAGTMPSADSLMEEIYGPKSATNSLTLNVAISHAVERSFLIKSYIERSNAATSGVSSIANITGSTTLCYSVTPGLRDHIEALSQAHEYAFVASKETNKPPQKAYKKRYLSKKDIAEGLQQGDEASPESTTKSEKDATIEMLLRMVKLKEKGAKRRLAKEEDSEADIHSPLNGDVVNEGAYDKENAQEPTKKKGKRNSYTKNEDSCINHLISALQNGLDDNDEDLNTDSIAYIKKKYKPRKPKESPSTATATTTEPTLPLLMFGKAAKRMYKTLSTNSLQADVDNTQDNSRADKVTKVKKPSKTSANDKYTSSSASSVTSSTAPTVVNKRNTQACDITLNLTHHRKSIHLYIDFTTPLTAAALTSNDSESSEFHTDAALTGCDKRWKVLGPLHGTITYFESAKVDLMAKLGWRLPSHFSGVCSTGNRNDADRSRCSDNSFLRKLSQAELDVKTPPVGERYQATIPDLLPCDFKLALTSDYHADPSATAFLLDVTCSSKLFRIDHTVKAGTILVWCPISTHTIRKSDCDENPRTGSNSDSFSTKLCCVTSKMEENLENEQKHSLDSVWIFDGCENLRVKVLELHSLFETDAAGFDNDFLLQHNLMEQWHFAEVDAFLRETKRHNDNLRQVWVNIREEAPHKQLSQVVDFYHRVYFMVRQTNGGLKRFRAIFQRAHRLLLGLSEVESSTGSDEAIWADDDEINVVYEKSKTKTSNNGGGTNNEEIVSVEAKTQHQSQQHSTQSQTSNTTKIVRSPTTGYNDSERVKEHQQQEMTETDDNQGDGDSAVANEFDEDDYDVDNDVFTKKDTVLPKYRTTLSRSSTSTSISSKCQDDPIVGAAGRSRVTKVPERYRRL